MKIFVIGTNYANSEEDIQAYKKENPTLFCKPDSALLKNNKAFYLPEFSQEIEYALSLVVQINRVGKQIAQRFANRYYDSVGVGVNLTAKDIREKLQEKGLPWEISTGFDGSSRMGKFLPLSSLSKINELNIRLSINGHNVQDAHTSHMIHSVDELISYISQFYTLKTGDIIFTGSPVHLGTLSTDDHLEAFLEDQLLVDFYIK